jgi:hypothetical protein
MFPDGNAIKRITHRPALHSVPDWSRGEGRYLAYSTRGCGWLLDIFVYDLVSDKEYRVTRLGGRDPSWGNSDIALVYVKMDPRRKAIGDNGYLHVLNIRTGEEKQVTFDLP